MVGHALCGFKRVSFRSNLNLAQEINVNAMQTDKHCSVGTQLVNYFIFMMDECIVVKSLFVVRKRIFSTINPPCLNRILTFM
jgi:hypothetical protein